MRLWRLRAQHPLDQMLVLLLATGALWLLHLFARTLPSWLLLLCWLLLSLLLAMALYWQRRLRRRAWLGLYVAPTSHLQTWLRGGLGMWLGQLLLAAALALVLLLGLVRITDANIWLLLFAQVPVLVLLQALWRRWLAGHLSSTYLPLLSWRLSLWLQAVLLLALLLWLALQRPQPDFAGVSLERALWHLVNAEQARSQLLQNLLQLAAAKEALQLWLGQQLLPASGSVLLQVLGWILLLAAQGLFLWSYMLFNLAIVLVFHADDRNVKPGPIS